MKWKINTLVLDCVSEHDKRITMLKQQKIKNVIAIIPTIYVLLSWTNIWLNSKLVSSVSNLTASRKKEEKKKKKIKY